MSDLSNVIDSFENSKDSILAEYNVELLKGNLKSMGYYVSLIDSIYRSIKYLEAIK